MKKISNDLKGIAVVALCDFAAISFSILISLLAVDRTVHLSLNILWWYLANIALSYVFLILFRLYYFIFDSVGLLDTLKILGACLLIFGTGCSYSAFFSSVWHQFVYSLTLFFLVLAIRYSKRIYVMLKYSITRSNKGKVRAMIVGGGNAGTALIR